MTKEPPKGQRFSHAYLERGKPTADSARMRRRISALVEGTEELAKNLESEIESELGIDIPFKPYGSDWAKFFETCDLRDALDTVTVAWRYLARHVRQPYRDRNGPEKWIAGVRRIFAEENVGYRVDDQGGVHIFVDQEFESNRVATLQVLGSARYANVLAEFEGGYAELSAVPPNGKNAVRGTFAAAEGLFRLMFASSPRLTSKETRLLAPMLQRVYADDPPALGAASKLLASFQEWVDAAHFYRHESGREEIAQPPLSLAINLVSLGTSYIRWLAEIDAAQQGGKGL